MEKIKVIFHMNTLDKWKRGLANVRNLIADLSDSEYDIIMLANGEAVRYYAKNNGESDLEKLLELSKQGVHFKACQNALNGNKLVQDDLHFFIEVVPAGITELVRKQHEGYAYIKP